MDERTLRVREGSRAVILDVLFAFLLALTPSQPAVSQADLFCLTSTVYGEAQGESDLGKALVAQAVLNRVGTGRGRETICRVVSQRKQFAGFKARRESRALRSAVWRQSADVAADVLAGRYRLGTCGTATHFDGVHFKQAAWTRSKRMQFLCRVDNQRFFKELPNA